MYVLKPELSLETLQGTDVSWKSDQPRNSLSEYCVCLLSKMSGPDGPFAVKSSRVNGLRSDPDNGARDPVGLGPCLTQLPETGGPDETLDRR